MKNVLKNEKYLILQIVLDVIGIVVFFTLPEYMPYFIALLAMNLVLVFGVYVKLEKKHNKELAFSILSLIVFLSTISFLI